MCDTLKQLVDIGTFVVLQDKLEDWLDSFKFNTCDQNVSIGCEIIELNAKLQGQLFKLLSLCASEGGTYGGARVLKTRLLPILGQGFFTADTDYVSSRSELKQIPKNYKSSKDSKGKFEKPMDDFQIDMTDNKRENEILKSKLEETKLELERQGRQSSSEKMFDKEEISNLRNQLDGIKEENEQLKSKARLTHTYQQEVEHLKADVALLSTHKSLHGLHSQSFHSPCDSCHSMYGQCHNYERPLDSCYIHHGHAKEQHLVSKLNDLFSVCRNDAMQTLLKYSDDHDNNQKIIFHSIMESFNAAKSAFRLYKSKIRNDMIGHHTGCSLEDSVQNYINTHADHELYVINLCREVIAALDFKVTMIRRPSGLSFDVIISLIREACKIAWGMLSLPIPIDVYHPASDGELFDESRYRRSFDSDYSATFVSHHIWPSLTKNGLVIAKGEAVTKKSTRSVLSPPLPLSRHGDISPSSTLMSSSSMSFRSKSPISKRPY